MARKHLYFKLNDQPEMSAADLQIARAEIEFLLGPVRQINNVLDLMNIEDIRHLIAKHDKLKFLLTRNLPVSHSHGIICSTEAAAPMEILTRRLVYTGEIFLFQKVPEDAGSFLNSLLSVGLASQYNVYNWDVFHLPVLHSYLRAFYKNYVENEEKTHADMLEEIKEDLISGERTASVHLGSKNAYKNEILESLLFSSWNSGLLNTLSKGNLLIHGNKINDPSWMIKSSLYGIRSVINEANPLAVIRSRGVINALNISSNKIDAAIDRWLEKQKEMLSNEAEQLSIKFSGNKNNFHAIHAQEMVRLGNGFIRRYGRNFLSRITALRYLLENNEISSEQAINNILLFIFQELVQKFTGSSRRPTDIEPVIRKSFEQLFSQVEMLQILTRWFDVLPGEILSSNDSLPLCLSKIKYELNAAIILFNVPAANLPSRKQIDTLRLLGYESMVNKIKEQSLVDKPSSTVLIDSLKEQWSQPANLFNRLGKPVLEFLETVESARPEPEFYSILKQLLDLETGMAGLEKSLASGGKLALVISEKSSKENDFPALLEACKNIVLFKTGKLIPDRDWILKEAEADIAVLVFCKS